jgi:hypothetical protein
MVQVNALHILAKWEHQVNILGAVEQSVQQIQIVLQIIVIKIMDIVSVPLLLVQQDITVVKRQIVKEYNVALIWIVSLGNVTSITT